MKTIRKHEFFHQCNVPTATAQQRKHGTAKGWRTAEMKYAKALFEAVFSEHKCEPFTGWLKVEINIMYPHTDKSGKLAAKHGVPRIPMTNKPDWDNAAKIPCDAMKKAGMIDEDAHIYDGHLLKWRSDIEGIQILIEEHAL